MSFKSFVKFSWTSCETLVLYESCHI